jgi:hypothetical protein
MVSLIADLMQDWRRLDERIGIVSTEIEALALQDDGCQRLMTVPGVGPIISSAMVAAIGNGAGFKQGRDFSAWLGLVPKQESTGDRTILGKISARNGLHSPRKKYKLSILPRLSKGPVNREAMCRRLPTGLGDLVSCNTRSVLPKMKLTSPYSLI